MTSNSQVSKSVLPIGIDISDATVEVVQFAHQSDQLELIGWSRESLPPGLVHSGKILDKDKLVFLIKQIFSNPKFGQFKGKDVNSNLPEDLVINKIVSYSPPKKANIEEVLAQEPFTKSLVWTWLPRHSDALHQELFWAGVPVSHVQDRKKIFAALDLNLASLEMESAVIFRGVVKELKFNEAVMIIDIGRESSFSAIYDDIGPLFWASQPVGDQAFTREIASQLKISVKEAEIKKRTIGFNIVAKEKTPSILQAVINGFIHQAGQDLFRHQKHHGKKIKKIILSGGASFLPGIDRYISQLLQLEVVKSSVLIGLNLDKLPKTVPFLLPSSVGLAIRNLDHRPSLNFLSSQLA